MNITLMLLFFFSNFPTIIPCLRSVPMTLLVSDDLFLGSGSDLKTFLKILWPFFKVLRGEFYDFSDLKEWLRKEG